MESKKINQLATELAPELSDLTIIGDPTTGISKKITLSQMASLFTGTVEEYASLSAFPLVGTADTIYIALDTNILYRWNTGTSAYVELSPNVVSSLVFNDANGFDGTISLVGSVATLTITTALTQGSVPFIGASGALTQDNTNFFWDNSNKRLGINTNTPTGALDVFGSGIIGRLNGTSTNNAFLGFASAGSNKWSIGNVQSDHRFRIYNEAATSELFTVLPTGEIGIGIANPLTKLHIDGGASALIANLDANVSVAKSVSFRSDNSSRFNIEVSGTESGSNAGMDFYLRAYTDAGSLLSTPLTITRSTGAAAFISTISATGATLTSTQTNLVLNTTTNTSFSKLSFQDNGVEKGTILYANSAFAATSRRDKLEIANIGGINFITQNAPLTPDMVITSSGNVSIGNTNNTFKLDVSGTGRFTGALTGRSFSIVGPNGYSGQIIQQGDIFGTTGTNLLVQSSTGNSIGFLTNGGTTFNMFINTSGNVGIGTTSPSYKLSVVGPNGGNAISWTDNANNTGYLGIRAGGAASIGADNNLVFETAATERMRITGGGIVMINRTVLGGQNARLQMDTSGSDGYYVQQQSSGGYCYVGVATSNGGTFFFNTFQAGSTQVGQITSNGSTTTYATSSDYRIKEDFKDSKGLEKVSAIKIYDFKYKDTENRMDGVIAHELQEIIPYAVVGEKDGEKMQGVDYSLLVPTLVKAIQELKTEIDILKAK